VGTLLIYTGGTIGMASKGTGALVPDPLKSLISHIPELNEKFQSQELECLAVKRIKDSSNVSPKDWLLWRDLIDDYEGVHESILVLHGTDTMAFTCSAIAFLMAGKKMNIVFTGSQVPIGQENTDAKINLMDSIVLLDELRQQQIIGKTLLRFGGKTFQGSQISKISTEAFDAFEGEAFAFEKHDENKKQALLDLDKIRVVETDVALLKIFPGINLKATMKNLLKSPPKGILLETFGSGNIPDEPTFINGLKNLIEKQVLILNISQCRHGRINMNKYDTGVKLAQAGVINGQDMNTEEALIKLMLILSSPQDHKAKLLVKVIENR
jgi:L-asparaginase